MCDLTVIILTKNEEVNIEKCILSVKRIAKYIYVVDSYSTDSTVRLAERQGAIVVEHEFINQAEQFNWAINNLKISTEWILRLDADEEILPKLATEIEEKLDKLDFGITGVILKRRIIFMGKWLKHGGMYPVFLLRIFRKGFGMSENRIMDEHIIVTSGGVVTFENDFCDNDKKDLTLWIEKQDGYTTRHVEDYFKKKEDLHYNEMSVENTKTSNQTRIKRFLKYHLYYKLPMFSRAYLYYFYRYYIRFGFLDGVEGKIFSFLQAYSHRFIIDAKIYEHEKRIK